MYVKLTSGENLRGGQLQESSKNLLEPLGVRYRIPREVPDRVLRTLGAGFLEVRLRGPNRVLRTLHKRSKYRFLSQTIGFGTKVPSRVLRGSAQGSERGFLKGSAQGPKGS